MAKVIPFPLKNLRPLRVRVVWPNGRENEECSLFILTLPFQDIDQALDVAWKIASLGHELTLEIWSPGQGAEEEIFLVKGAYLKPLVRA